MLKIVYHCVEMIESFLMKAGRSPEGLAETIQAQSINVFIGPYGSGKSRTLTAICHHCTGYWPEGTQPDWAVQSLSYRSCPEQELDRLIKKFTRPPTPGLPDHDLIVGSILSYERISRQDAFAFLRQPHSNPSGFVRYFLSKTVQLIGGEDRLRQVHPQNATDLKRQPGSILAMLFRNDELRAYLQKIVFNAFGFHLLVDPTPMTQFRYCVSERPAASLLEERGLTDDSLRLFGNAIGIEQFGDGVKAFIGLMAQAVAGEPLVLLIDEPEAFLHPSLAFKLGKELAITANDTSKRVFAATHSSSFLRGCIQSGVGVNIIRLTYDKGKATARLLPNAELVKLMRDPLLRSAGVLNALFHSAVVVCEGASDRVLYDEVNERLLQFNPPRGLSDCLFLDSGSKDTVRRIVGPLRKLGIPAAAVVDIDIIKKETGNSPTLLSAIGVPSGLHRGLGLKQACPAWHWRFAQRCR